MKICILTPTFLPQLGGTEIALDQLARHLQLAGHAVGVLTQQLRHGVSHDEDFPYPVRRYRRPLSLRGNFWGMRRALTRWHRQVGFDVISAHNAYPAGYAACVWGRKHQVPVVVTCRGSDVLETSRFRRRPMIMKRIHWSLNYADNVTALSENLARSVAEVASGRRPHVICNGVDSCLTEPVEAPVDQPWYSELSQSPYFLAMGRLHPIKGFHLLVQAYGEVCKTIKTMPLLVIAGSGRRQQELCDGITRQGLQSKILLLGQVTGNARQWLYQNCMAFILSSLRESFSLVLLEAMVCGRPILSTRCGGVASMLTNNKQGVLVESHSVDALRKGLEILLTKADLTALGRNGQKWVKTFHWPEITQQYFHVFEQSVISKKTVVR